MNARLILLSRVKRKHAIFYVLQYYAKKKHLFYNRRNFFNTNHYF